AKNHPIAHATSRKTEISAAGSASKPINVHLTKDIGPIPPGSVLALRPGSSMVARNDDKRRRFGATTGLVWPRDYIIAREPTSVPPIYPLRPVGRSRRLGSFTAAESMRDVFDIYTIIFLALAVFIFLRLRSVLGQRTGRERPPYDPFSARDPVRGGPKDGVKEVKDNVVSLPGRSTETADKPSVPVEPSERWKGITESGSSLAASLDAIAAADPSFDAKHFLAGARAAYEMVVTAFAEGDRRTLKNLLSREVFEGFDAAVSGREKRGEKHETRFVSIDTAEIVAAELRGRTAQATVRFISKLIATTRDASGAVIDGSPDKVIEVTDIWTFARDVTSRDPNWKLVATEAGQ